MHRVVPALGALAVLAGNAPAQGQVSVVSAKVAPVVGLGVDERGDVTSSGSTTRVSITRERHGNVVSVTVIPLD